MKKLLLCLVVGMLFLTSTALASDRLATCQQALTESSWKFTASSVEKSDAALMLIPETYGAIQLPNTGKIFEEPRTIPALNTLSVLQLPSNTEIIEEEAFSNTSFQAIIIPEGCKRIEAGAFSNCDNLIYVRMPQSVQYITPSAFSGCGSVIFDVK